MTEAEARAALRAFHAVGDIEQWIAEQRWERLPGGGGWRVRGQLEGSPSPATASASSCPEPVSRPRDGSCRHVEGGWRVPSRRRGHRLRPSMALHVGMLADKLAPPCWGAGATRGCPGRDRRACRRRTITTRNQTSIPASSTLRSRRSPLRGPPSVSPQERRGVVDRWDASPTPGSTAGEGAAASLLHATAEGACQQPGTPPAPTSLSGAGGRTLG